MRRRVGLNFFLAKEDFVVREEKKNVSSIICVNFFESVSQ